MVEAGILDGDIVVARHQETADRGDIVVALLDDEATVKRFDPSPDGVRLLPENASYDPIVVTGDDGIQLRIAGKVVGLMRQL
jgi:repressor LexA